MAAETLAGKMQLGKFISRLEKPSRHHQTDCLILSVGRALDQSSWHKRDQLKCVNVAVPMTTRCVFVCPLNPKECFSILPFCMRKLNMGRFSTVCRELDASTCKAEEKKKGNSGTEMKTEKLFDILNNLGLDSSQEVSRITSVAVVQGNLTNFLHLINSQWSWGGSDCHSFTHSIIHRLIGAWTHL